MIKEKSGWRSRGNASRRRVGVIILTDGRVVIGRACKVTGEFC